MRGDLVQRIELIDWVLDQIKNPNVCAVIESKMNKIIDELNKKDSITERDLLDSELRISDCIFCIRYLVTKSEDKTDQKK
jgi:hypothetical protein